MFAFGCIFLYSSLNESPEISVHGSFCPMQFDFPFVLSFPILCRSSSFFFSFKLNYWNYSRLSDLIYLQNIKRNALKDWKKRPCRKSQFMENVFKIGKLPFIESDKLNRQYNFN